MILILGLINSPRAFECFFGISVIYTYSGGMMKSMFKKLSLMGKITIRISDDITQIQKKKKKIA